ncbi:class II aldolase/adducin family protein [Limibacillus sp. MBR-115]|jgi:ribulose-5-phosphate 4-epimerase/fuculose-1-phosphate aldolase|uniref:class II aldolase/adducin family protein n=1 Tax=Limibacillus sp. MBR-115 TaxID=3156465 RepID=UPI003394B0C1
MQGKEGMDQEWEVRCNLAALFRIFHLLGIEDMIYTHFSARLPGERDRFLINPYGHLFEEVTASNLVAFYGDQAVEPEDETLNQAGIAIHSSLYQARPDIGCIIHTHSRAGAVVAASREGLQPISQDALEIFDEIACHDYGVPASQEEKERLAEDCRQANCLILRNHGLLVVGESIPSAFIRMYFLERACELQAAAYGMPGGAHLIDQAVQDRIAQRMAEVRQSGRYGELLWQAVLRRLERSGQEYRL